MPAATKKSGCCWLGRNVSLNLAFSAINALASAIIAANFFSVYIQQAPGGGNEAVGFISATAGIAMIVFALPAGFLADNWSRSNTLRLSAMIGLAASTLRFFALQSSSILLLYVSNGAFGAFWAMSSAPLAAIMADSVEAGQRTTLFILQYTLGLLAAGVAPAAVCVFYWQFGDTWDQGTLSLVLQVGNAINVFSCGFLFFFSDAASLGKSSETLLRRSKGAGKSKGSEKSLSKLHPQRGVSAMPLADAGVEAGTGSVAADSPHAAVVAVAVLLESQPAHGAALPSTSSVNADLAPLLSPVSAHPDSPPWQVLDSVSDTPLAPAADGDAGGSSKKSPRKKRGSVAFAAKPEALGESDDEDDDEDDAAEPASVHNLGHQRLPLGCVTLTVRAVPPIIFASDMTMAMGAGMTVAYFALYFKSTYDLSPLALAGIFAGTPVCIAALSLTAIPLARLLGRAASAVLFDALGTAALAGMSFPLPLWAGVGLYMLRTAAMNAGYPTQRAILMDVVPKRDRGKWSALESVTAFTWTGSAALGGFLVDLYGYDATFRATAGLYVLSTAILALVVPLTWGEVVDRKRAPAAEAEAEVEGGGKDGAAAGAAAATAGEEGAERSGSIASASAPLLADHHCDDA